MPRADGNTDMTLHNKKSKKRKKVNPRPVPTPKPTETKREFDPSQTGLFKGNGWIRARYIWGVIFAGICFFITVYESLPRLSISVSGMLAPQNPFSTQFEVINDGYLDARNVDVTSDSIKSDSHHGAWGVHFNIGRLGSSQHADRLGKGEKITFKLNNDADMGQMPGTADITVSLIYKIHWLPFLGIQRFKQHFSAVTNFSGNIQWNSEPSN